ncbi:MAG: hypothetical protein ABI177_12735 [Edaphobacter sp.]
MTKQMENEKLAVETMSDPRWLSVVDRNKGADGIFLFRQDNRRVLPPVLRCTPRTSGKRSFLHNDGSS